MTSVSGSSAVPAKVSAGFGPGALLTPANLLTLGRIAATPPFLWHLNRHPVGWTTLAMWFALCVTDLLDGKLARRHGATRSGPSSTRWPTRSWSSGPSPSWWPAAGCGGCRPSSSPPGRWG